MEFFYIKTILLICFLNIHSVFGVQCTQNCKSQPLSPRTNIPISPSSISNRLDAATDSLRQTSREVETIRNRIGAVETNILLIILRTFNRRGLDAILAASPEQKVQMLHRYMHKLVYPLKCPIIISMHKGRKQVTELTTGYDQLFAMTSTVARNTRANWQHTNRSQLQVTLTGIESHAQSGTMIANKLRSVELVTQFYQTVANAARDRELRHRALLAEQGWSEEDDRLIRIQQFGRFEIELVGL